MGKPCICHPTWQATYRAEMIRRQTIATENVKIGKWLIVEADFFLRTGLTPSGPR
jgi:hypothetical protein